MTDPLIQLRSYQQALFTLQARIAFFVWRRQCGKSYAIAAKCLQRMLSRKSHSCFIVSASISTGKEVIEKEAAMWYDALASMQRAAELAGAQLGGNLLDSDKHILASDDIADIMQKQSAVVKLYHTRTQYSRTMIVAPNPATCRGWTGDVYGDEFAFWEQFEEVWDGVEPFITSNPEYNLWCFTTPPKNDAHPSHALLNPRDTEFSPNSLGNYYETADGYPVHRVDAEDTHAAGVPMYHPKTARPCTYAEYRESAIDKIAADRNYMLRFTAGGVTAIGKAHMDRAIDNGRTRCTAIDLSGDRLLRHDIPRLIGTEWAALLQEGAATALGLDLASTIKETSNPSALCVMQEINARSYEVLNLRFKTDDTETLVAVLRYIISCLSLPLIKGLAVDTSNEKFAGSTLKSQLPCRVVGYSGGQNVTFEGVACSAKYAMGAAYVGMYESGRLGTASDDWLSRDRQLVTRDGDKYVAALSKEGYHADTFDAAKLANWELHYARPQNNFPPIPFNRY